MSKIKIFLTFLCISFMFCLLYVVSHYSQNNEQKMNIDPKLVKDIMEGHHILEQATKVMSGKVSFTYSNSENETFVTSPLHRQFSYYKDNDLLRLDFTNPQDDTKTLPNNKNNDFTEIILSAKDYNYRYLAVPTTVNPLAQLFKSKKTNSTSDLAFTSVFSIPIRSLYTLGAVRITDLLQDRTGKIEYRQYENIPDALWIHGVEHVSKSGGQSKWTVVLNPEECYALLYYELSVKNNSIKFSTETKQKVISQKAKDGKIFAKVVTSHSITNGKPVNEQYVISVDSTSKPDDKMFSEDCFKQIGRDYVIVDELPDQKQKMGTFVKAAP